MEMHNLIFFIRNQSQTMKDRIAKALKETRFNPELFFHFWSKDRETAMLAYSQLSIQTMRGLADNIKVLDQEASFFQFDRRSNLSLCIDSCKARLKTKESQQFEKVMAGSTFQLQRKYNIGTVEPEKKIVVNKLQDKKALILKALEASGYDAEVFLSFETKDWEAAHLAYKQLSIMKMKELLDDLRAMEKETSFFLFKRKRELQSCLYICEGSFWLKKSMLSDEEREEYTSYLRRKDIVNSQTKKRIKASCL